MKKFKLFLVFSLISLIFFNYVNGLGISSNKYGFLERIDFEPGKKYVYEYYIEANDGYLADYEFFVESKSLVDLRQYVRVEPDKFSDVPAYEKRAFKVNLDLPNKIDSPGENEILVWLRGIAKDSSGGLVARPVVGLRYLIYVLYPWKAIDYSISLPPINKNDVEDFSIKIRNIGEPTINLINADIEVYNSDNELIRKIKTNDIYNLKSKEEKNINATFDSNGLLKGEYYAIAYINYDNNVSNLTYNFNIGQKNVKILNFTKLIEFKQINKFFIEIESEWNKNIDKVYASVDIYNLNKKTKLHSFRTLDFTLDRLEKKTIESYFDATNFEKGEYIAVVNLFYEGSSTAKEEKIKIDENVNLNVVDEIPGKFSFKSFLSGITLVNVLIFLLIVFILLFMYLSYYMLKSNFNKNKNENKNQNENLDNLNSKKENQNNNLLEKDNTYDFDDAIIDKIIDLKRLFNDEEIKNKLIKKGWNPKKVEQLFLVINKKNKK